MLFIYILSVLVIFYLINKTFYSQLKLKRKQTTNQNKALAKRDEDNKDDYYFKYKNFDMDVNGNIRMSKKQKQTVVDEYYKLLPDYHKNDVVNKQFYEFCFNTSVHSTILNLDEIESKHTRNLQFLFDTEGSPYLLSIFSMYMNQVHHKKFEYQNKILSDSLGYKPDITNIRYPIYSLGDVNYLDILENNLLLDLENLENIKPCARAFITHVENGIPKDIFVLVKTPFLGYSVRKILDLDGLSGVYSGITLSNDEINTYGLEVAYKSLYKHLI